MSAATATVEPLTDGADGAGGEDSLSTRALPARLQAAEPSWDRATDVLVIGSGVAGLALARALTGSGLRIELVTKAALRDGSTRWAQGGVATADAPGDDVRDHLNDTLTAGAGLCDEQAVRVLVTEGPLAVQDVLHAGANFDREPDGRLAFTREGGHSRARVAHAGGDATGLEVQRTLETVVLADPMVTVREHTFVLDLLTAGDTDSTVCGALLATLDQRGNCLDVGLLRARAVVLATGGMGRLYAETTNPDVATGDGLAAALRAGAQLIDLEFIQFHPTVLAASVGGASGSGRRQLLISEAVRGEGAVLTGRDGVSIMAGRHPLADLAPRDVVSATIAEHLATTGDDHVLLDATRLGAAVLLRRFPTIVAGCRAAGIDPVHESIPVAPAAHYSCGGIRADMTGRTTLPGLYALGEVAGTGVHGANRLASNSLLEGLVTARRLGAQLRRRLPALRSGLPPAGPAGLVDPALRAGLTRQMVREAGVLRRPQGLADLAATLAETSVTYRPAAASPGRAEWEATNLHSIMTVLVAAATRRVESRGSHRRTDVTDADPAWQRHVLTTMDAGFCRQVIA